MTWPDVAALFAVLVAAVVALKLALDATRIR